MRQSVCLVLNIIKVAGYVFLLNCTAAVRASDNDGRHISKALVGWGLMLSMFWAWSAVVQLVVFCRISQEHSSLLFRID